MENEIDTTGMCGAHLADDCEVCDPEISLAGIRAEEQQRREEREWLGEMFAKVYPQFYRNAR